MRYNGFATLDEGIAAVPDDGAIEVTGGVISFADGCGRAVTVDAAAMVVGTATFDKAITINGTVAFDTAYATATSAQFGGFSYVSGDTTYTLKANAVAAPTCSPPMRLRSTAASRSVPLR